MKVVPMIFNTDMVKALMAGDKVVTRRPLIIHEGWELKDRKLTKITSSHPKKGKWGALIRQETFDDKYQHDIITAPCFVDDLIYVRETFTPDPDVDHDSWNDHELSYAEWVGCEMSSKFLPDALKVNEHCLYKADCKIDMKWTPSIHMPRWASRLTLKVTDVRIERVQDITEEQCWKEGVEHIDGQFDIHQLSEMAKTFDGTFEDAKALFACLWDSIYQNWKENPYVWIIEFEVIHQNVDKYLESVKEAA
ncbi:ASCH domain-containing protein [Vibrio metoecus]|uniref:hypothetical protein n=1 Tax=Vibrio metoecus TaxID=1481663 RepID=UPI000BA97197|nr:hypothetical protein [Vibrio metoecus]PAR35852.1 hypothetical protein CGT97_09820 [Vibrio metoecus]PAR40434.1 hypothetical protein CGT96_17845 [Vibrio metoecus]PAR54056.1 hypothetical protein CGT93_10400 [Vibrio metoecus]